jgi:hypothetical protein
MTKTFAENAARHDVKSGEPGNDAAYFIGGADAE